MSDADTSANQPPMPILGAILSYLVPGLGQIVQGRVFKGVLFMVCLLGLFHVGQAMGEWRVVYLPSMARGPEENWRHNRWKLFRPLANVVDHRWHFAGQFWIGVAAWPAIIQYNEWPMPLVDRFPVLKDYQLAPSEDELNQRFTNQDKTPDLAWVYTVIAGMLNILVIYDAYAGPAHPRRKKPEESPALTPAPAAVQAPSTTEVKL